MLSLRYVPLTTHVAALPLFNVARTFATKSIEKVKPKPKKDENKVPKEAFKIHKRLGSFAYYVKQMRRESGISLDDLAQDWRNLSNAEKKRFKAETDTYNEELFRRFPPKPTAPPTNFGAYIKEHYPHDSDKSKFVEITKGIASQWKQLTPAEKNAYNAPKSEWEKYEQSLKRWKEHRVANYKERNAA